MPVSGRARLQEPQLKYNSLGGDVSAITSTEAVTCLCLSDKILALGTETGNVHVLDYSGHEVRCLKLHQGRVNDLSFDKAEEHIASCSNDCTVVVINLYTEEKQQFTYKKPIRTIAVDPRYSLRRTKEYVAAGDDSVVALSTQGWLGRSDYKLYEGHVQLVRWAGALVAWATDRFVTVYDTNTHAQLRTITRYPPARQTSSAAGAGTGAPPAPAAAPVKGRASLLFGENSRMYISWPDCIKVARIISVDGAVGGTTHKVEVTSEFYTDYFVLGVSPFGEDLAVLTYPTLSELAAREQAAAEEQAQAEHSEIVPEGTHAASLGASSGGAHAAGNTAGRGVEAKGARTHAVEPGQQPQLRILSTSNLQLAADELPIAGYGSCSHTDYLLVPSLPATTEAATSSKLLKRGWWASLGGGGLGEALSAAAASDAAGNGDAEAAGSGFKAADIESMYFIVSPRSILVSCTRDMNDHVLWLLDQQRFDEALQVAEADRVGVQAETYEQVVQCYSDELLLHRKDWAKAAKLSRRLLKDSARQWELWVALFAQASQLPKLAPHIPTERPRLHEKAYETVLCSLLVDQSDHGTLLGLVRTWPNGLYSVTALQDAVAARMARPGGDDEHMWRLLSLLYVRQGRPELCLAVLLQLRAPDVFDFVEKHALIAELSGARASALLDIDEEAALKLLTRAADQLPPSAVVPAIQAAMRDAERSGGPAASEVWRKRLYRYLAGVLSADASAAIEYHELQVQLTADFAPGKLMEFLAASQYYPLEGALTICQQRGLVAEQVYILGRMGNSRQALHIIIEKLGDVPQAIDFVRSQCDEELWDYLITWALGSSETTGSLMDHAGGSINPLLLLRRLPRGLEVPRLRDRIRTIIGDFRTQTSLHEGCNAILHSDCMHLMQKLYAEARMCLRCCYVELRDARSAGAVQWRRSMRRCRGAGAGAQVWARDGGAAGAAPQLPLPQGRAGCLAPAGQVQLGSAPGVVGALSVRVWPGHPPRVERLAPLHAWSDWRHLTCGECGE
uniref:Vps41 beta-propeller domain-containing protein n=1 Tax=Chlamydomonas euryale TaxID=1486919 RepID=A0A7R9YQY0_9CHLO|mmetsp:Transcript_14973/g.44079  ORF Transcript_14973/g.44079 Transcript_14973/m.44079 type:complete len:1019 (+) Transcript_14973:131-3187(+)